MIGKKINQLATELAPVSTDLTIIGDPTTGVSKKITLAQLGAIFSGAVSFYTNLAGFPAVGDINVIYCAKDTQKLYLWSGSAYVEVFPSQALLDTYQLRSEKGNANGYASLDSQGKVPISQLPSSIMEYKGTWNASTNTPTLTNGTGDTGDVYICNVAGTVNFGAGPITFAVGDYVIYSGTIWQRSSGAVGTVTSVAVSRSGDALAITGSPVTTSGTINIGFAGNSTQYINGAGNLVTFPGVINEAQNLITEVYNKTGATLTKGTVVYINGGQGNLPAVTKALATGDSTSAQTYGIVRNDITNNNNGYVVVAGRISDLDTQAYTEGTQLYLSPTTAGTFTSTKPYAPQHLVYVGIVVRAHPTQGVVEVKIQNGYELDELHNVAAQSPSNGDILQYVSSTSLWTKVAGTTSNIAEGSNLYYTDARSRAALSFTAGSGAYNSTTGVITIPTNTNQLTNGANYITLASLSAGAGISYNNTTGVIASTITQYTDANARAAISLTTSGTSGAATYNSTTGVLNVPQYAPDLSGYVPTSRTLTINGTAYDLSANRSWSVGTVTSVGLSSATSGVTIGSTPITTSGTITLAIATASGSQQGLLSSTDWTTFNNKQNALTNPVTGTGTTNYLPKFTGTSTIGDSTIQETNSNIGIGVTPTNGYGGLQIVGATSSSILTQLGVDGIRAGVRSSGNTAIVLDSSNTTFTNRMWYLYNAGASGSLIIGRPNLDVLTFSNSGNLGLGVTPSAWGSTVRALQFENGGSIASNQSTQVSFNNNVYSVPGTNDYYISSAFATRYIQFQGQHIWSTAPSGTAGNAISFTQAMTLNASGQLSLGITAATGNANRILHINGADSAELHLTRSNSGSSSTFGGYVNFDGSNNFNIQNRTGGAINLITGTTTALTIASTGAATFSSSVSGSLIRANDGVFQLYRASAFRGGLYTFDAAIGSGTDYSSTLTSETDINFLTGGSITKKVTFLANGNVGIGTTSPQTLFTVSGANQALGGAFNTYGNVLITSNEGPAINRGGSFSLGGRYWTESTTIATFGRIHGKKEDASDGSTAGYLSFETTREDGALLFERMRINSVGNVGIGTTSPDQKLTIQAQGTSNGLISFKSAAGTTTSFVGVPNANGDVISSSGTADLCFRNETGNMLFATNGNSEKMRITSGGAVEMTGTIKTASPSSGSAHPWKLGSYAAGGTGTATGVIYIEVNGQIYSIPALLGTP